MKKQWLPLVFVVLLMLAPAVRAEDGSAPGSFEQLITQIVTVIVGDESEIGEVWPPWGANEPADESEIGEIWPPNGAAAQAGEPEIGSIWPPNG
jgi:hypothetical protein